MELGKTLPLQGFSIMSGMPPEALACVCPAPDGVLARSLAPILASRKLRRPCAPCGCLSCWACACWCTSTVSIAEEEVQESASIHTTLFQASADYDQSSRTQPE